MSLPLLLTMGDPVGIGPEIIVRAHAAGALDEVLVVGDPAVLARAQAVCGLPPAAVPVWLPPGGLEPSLATLPWGRVDARAGAAAAACITAATREVLAGRARALVTAPIHKEALAAAGLGVPGHTELLQSLASAHVGRALPVRMMLANDELRVVLVTIHMALRRAIETLDTPGILETIVITHEALQRFGIAAPRIAVAGLNPHAGEGGLFGDEEIRLITPAIEAACARGIDARGPFAPDTVFMRARDSAARPGEFDAVVAMTHDHGLIPVKYLGVEQGVNLTLGLPLVRTSPDHGTAFDIAGRGLADPASLLAALRMARRLAPG
ncbi:4-hydroxythreonine-4-phosphate dehydrogenase PdxA [Ideonella sp. 4Y16]|uniref:4-hydroxythreonine-4-phosphate dehydrogenase PdxA n=1 Tax=Ideonella alba TaxID=2824118 RepID=UPI001B385831|nr:4-hydroxythreonine-4-phosphate dehydrogenase PdxA [Ideonella alba]MBQ0944225.1 4-hydroxythreonine-4-phosphate dehydrogenase PdxA [Ideonella alba]